MKHFTEVLICLAFLAGCQASSVKDFWIKHDIDYSDIDAAQEQFADFAELAAAAPEEDALAAMDLLFGKLQKDTVAYYLYSYWLDDAFYNVLSPCRNAALYTRAVEHLVANGILSPGEYAPYLRQRDWIQYNQPGAQAVIPSVNLTGAKDSSARTLVLVLDLGCPTCREALSSLSADTRWADTRKLALCCGYGPTPGVEGWEYVFPENAQAVFDLRMTPVYFVVAPDGTVETSYTPAI